MERLIIASALLVCFSLAVSEAFIVNPWFFGIFKPHLGDKEWSGFFNDLASNGPLKHLSPINIDTTKAKRIKVPPLRFSRNHWDPNNVYLVNNTGHYSSFMPVGPNKILTLSGGPLKSTYQLDNLHAHWHPTDNTNGTEHSINKRKYAMEFHAVYFKRSYGSMEKAAGRSDGLAVCAFVIESSTAIEKDGPFEKLAEVVGTISEPYSFALLKYNALLPFRRIALSEQYYHYSGSVTAAIAYPAKWMIFKTFYKINPSQIENFRKMRDPKGEIIDNVNDKMQDPRPVFYIDNSLPNSHRKHRINGGF